MNNLNYVLLQGRITMDPEMSEPVAGVPLCRFTIAVNRYFVSKEKKGFQEQVSYFRIETWYRLAENCFRYLSKGREIRVTGRLQQDRWKDSSGLRERVSVFAQHIEFAGRKKEAESSAEAQEVAKQDEIPEELSADENDETSIPTECNISDMPIIGDDGIIQEDAESDAPF